MSGPEIFEHLRGVFFEEANEGIATMESSLMSFEKKAFDSETLNGIFRAAHSIKGAAGGFGFEDITKFTHVMESLLDELRSGTREVDAKVVDILLGSVDHLRALLEAAAHGGRVDEELSKNLIGELERLLSRSGSTADASVSNAVRCLCISFVPHSDLLSVGSDPTLIFKELASFGEFRARVKANTLPPFEDLNPQSLYLSWEIYLDTEVMPEQVVEAFDWVEEHCSLEVSTLTELWDDEPEDDTSQKAPEPPQTPPSIESTSESKAEKRVIHKPVASIRVGIDKIDNLMDIVGELVITQSMICQIERDFDIERLGQLRDGLSELARQTRELQESVMRVRMVPIGAVFSRFPRVVRDVRASVGKEVELQLSGETTEVDKTVSEQLADPLTHLVRNALDHGLESPDDRRALGKDPTGSLKLSARHEGGNVVIDIIDDGRGIDSEKVLSKAQKKGLLGQDERPSEERIYDLIFLPGFSTADKVSALSGRGVGLDVVAKNIRNLGGTITTSSKLGVGTCFSIRIPMTLSILDAQLVRIVDQVFIVPLLSIVESVLVKKESIHTMVGREEVYRLRNEYITVIRASDVLGLQREEKGETPRLLVVVEDEGKRVGVLVDELLDQQQVVIKSLETNYMTVSGFSGATILGDGKVAFIIDVAGFVKLATRQLSTIKAPAESTLRAER